MCFLTPEESLKQIRASYRPGKCISQEAPRLRLPRGRRAAAEALAAFSLYNPHLVPLWVHREPVRAAGPGRRPSAAPSPDTAAAGTAGRAARRRWAGEKLRSRLPAGYFFPF